MLERSQVRALETREVGNAARPAWLDTIAAAPIVLFVLGMYVYCFGIANRYLVFLYDHLGLSPFDVETRSRYWMAGFVTTGYVMVGYVSANWTLARLAAWRGWSYHPPSWHRVWRFCSAPLILGIPTITMTMSWPTLPPLDAVLSALAALLGLALALWPGELAARRPVDLLWLALDGATLLPVLGLLRVAELALGETSHARLALLAVPISILSTFIGLVAMTLLRHWRGRLPPPPVKYLPWASPRPTCYFPPCTIGAPGALDTVTSPRHSTYSPTVFSFRSRFWLWRLRLCGALCAGEIDGGLRAVKRPSRSG